MVVGHAHIAHKSPLFVLSFSLPSPKRMTTMPTLPTPLAIMQPDQVSTAVDNMLALDLISTKQARLIRMLANQPHAVTVERIGRAVHVHAGDRHMRVMSKGAVRYL